MLVTSSCVVLAVLVWCGVALPTPSPRRLRGRSSAQQPSAVEAFVPVLDAIATAVAAGANPAAACAAACTATADSGSPVATELRAVAEQARTGGDLGQAWAAVADSRDCAGLRAVAAGWTLSERVGAPLTDSLGVAAELLRGELTREGALRVAAAGPRASMNLLTALPVIGALGAAALGADLTHTYFSPLGAVTLLPGLLLILLGRRWSARLIARSTRVTVLS